MSSSRDKNLASDALVSRVLSVIDADDDALPIWERRRLQVPESPGVDHAGVVSKPNRVGFRLPVLVMLGGAAMFMVWGASRLRPYRAPARPAAVSTRTAPPVAPDAPSFYALATPTAPKGRAPPLMRSPRLVRERPAPTATPSTPSAQGRFRNPYIAEPLSGEALRVALIEDARRTRELNQSQLDPKAAQHGDPRAAESAPER